jgi:ribonuclease HI
LRLNLYLAQKSTDSDIIAYTDGACKGNPGIGDWGIVLVFKEDSKEFFGAEANTTNNRMELIAAITAIEEAFKRQASRVLVYTDSQYVQKGKRNGLQTGRKIIVEIKKTYDYK